MKIQLVNPCMNDTYEVNSRNGVIHPLGLISIATVLEQKFPEFQIEILDGSILRRDEINSRINGNIVGCSIGVLNYEHALEIGGIAKNMGSTTVLGGPLASDLYEIILSRRPEIDYIIRGEGESAMVDLISGVAPETISNVAMRSSKGIISHQITALELDGIPFANRSFVNIQEYYNNYSEINVAKRFVRPMSFYSGKGCCYASQRGRCVFCARMDKGYRTRTPERVWEELQYLSDIYKADSFWDVADSVLNDIDWLRRFAKSKPNNYNPFFHIYGRSDGVSIEAVEYLKEINCHLIFMGFESGSQKILGELNLSKNVDCAKRAAVMLAENRINLMGSFILGLQGETYETLQKTLEFASWLNSIGNLETISASVIIPLPGSRVFSMLSREYPEKYKNNDLINVEDARNDWFRTFTKISIDQVYKILPQFLEFGKISSSLAKPVNVAKELQSQSIP